MDKNFKQGANMYIYTKTIENSEVANQNQDSKASDNVPISVVDIFQKNIKL